MLPAYATLLSSYATCLRALATLLCYLPTRARPPVRYSRRVLPTLSAYARATMKKHTHTATRALCAYGMYGRETDRRCYILPSNARYLQHALLYLGRETEPAARGNSGQDRRELCDGARSDGEVRREGDRDAGCCEAASGCDRREDGGGGGGEQAPASAPAA
eukprot:2132423-Rhodomonas_salina.1